MHSWWPRLDSALEPARFPFSLSLSLFFFLRKSQEGSHWVSKKISCILSNNSMRPGCLKSCYLSAHWLGFPSGSDSKESACNVGDLGLIPGLGRSPGGGHGNPLQYSCLENPRGQRSLAGCSPWGCEESDTTEWLRMHDYHHGFMFHFGPIIPVFLVYPKYFDDSESKNMNFTNLDMIIGCNWEKFNLSRTIIFFFLFYSCKEK